MPKTTTKSVRELARLLGISHTTVSDALRNNPRVSLKTRARVQKAALETGYTYNPLAGAIMSEIRRSKVGAFRGVVAIVDLENAARRSPGATAYHAEILRGAKEAAGRLGFKVDYFILGEENISLPRLNNILASRGIRGILILPTSRRPKISELDWDHITGIYTDYVIDDPPIHTVSPDHFRSMTIALRQMLAMGYKRPSLVLEEDHDRRLLFRWEAAFCSFLRHQLGEDVIQPLVTNNLTREVFLDWFKETKTDVVLAHSAEVLTWMKEAGCQVPETHGFCCLNVTSAELNASGLDLLPRLAGNRAMESLIAQLHRNEYGIPKIPSTVTYSAVWTDGPTLRKLS